MVQRAVSQDWINRIGTAGAQDGSYHLGEDGILNRGWLGEADRVYMGQEDELIKGRHTYSFQILWVSTAQVQEMSVQQ
jgi:hypothetical protein